MSDPIRILVAGSRRVPRKDEARIRAAIEDAIARFVGRIYKHDFSGDTWGVRKGGWPPKPIVLVHGGCAEPKARYGYLREPHPKETSIDAIAGRLGREVYDGEETEEKFDLLQWRTKPDFAVLIGGGEPLLGIVSLLWGRGIPFEFIVPAEETS